MTILIFSFFLLITSILAGLVGALTGLGGGVILIPVLVLLFHIDIHYAMGASLISVIATSTGSAAAYLREGYTNLRIGMFLELGAVLGAFAGAILVAFLSKTFISVLFALILLLSAYLTYKRKDNLTSVLPSHPWANRLQLQGLHPTPEGMQKYAVQGVPLALFIMTIAGCLSGLLGIGSGVLKVLAMDQVMKLPYKVATTTSNFIIGITAAVSVGVYFVQGYIEPGITFPVMIGVAGGSLLGAKILVNVASQKLRLFFSLIICFMALELFYKAFTGGI